MRAAIAQHLEANKKAFELLHEAAGIEECRYPVDMTDGHAVLLPHLDKTNHIARLLRLEALHHAQRGEGEQAADSMAALLGLGRSLANEPILISYLVEHACDTRAVKSLEETLSIIALPEGQIVEPAAALEQAENAEAMRRAFVGEACSMHGAFQKAAGELGAYRGVPGIPRPLTVLYSTTGLLDLDDAACLKIMRDVIEASEKPLIERLQAMRSIDVEKRVENLPSYCILTKTLMPESEHAGEEDARHAAQLRAARTALAVERYRRTRGPLPQKLDDLVPEFMDAIPIDPFDGKPMRYNKLERGYVVYCIGPDGDDDGGKEREPGGGDDHDVPFTVAR
jgi:hypothetical protein